MAALQPGLTGLGFQPQEVISSVEGLFGISFGIDGNLVLAIQNTQGNPAEGVNITITWADGGLYQIINYDPKLLYTDVFPVNTPLQITVPETTRYQAGSSLVTIPSGVSITARIVLEFRESYFRITKKRFY